ncbi:MAG TPA: hypothetical protein VF401_04490 [Candidatus Saccharimonadales bacterium]
MSAAEHIPERGVITLARSSDNLHLLVHFAPPIEEQHLRTTLGLVNPASRDKDNPSLVKAAVASLVDFGRKEAQQDETILDFFGSFGKERNYDIKSDTIHRLGSETVRQAGSHPTLMDDPRAEAAAAEKYKSIDSLI